MEGTGNSHLLLFHGFGLTKEIFKPWTQHLGEKYRMICIDLFYHGESEKALGYLEKQEWKEILGGLLDHLSVRNFSVVGFSLGGRFAITSALEFTSRCEGLFLVGPDAVYKTPYFIIATSRGFRPLFKFLMFNPKTMDRFINMVVSLRIANKYLADFVRKELGVPENRRRVYIAWNHFKPLGYPQKELQKRLSEQDFLKVLIVGTRDIVIQPKKIVPILKDCGFTVLELDKKHHQLVKEETASELVKAI